MISRMPDDMRSYELRRADEVDALVATTRPVPEPGPGEVLVRVRATSLNFRDIGQMRAASAGTLPEGRIPLSDGAGEIVAVGAGVERPVDQRVMGNFFQGWVDGPYRAGYGDSALGGAIDGMLSEYVVLRADCVVEVPDVLTFEEAATLPCAGVTAYNALFRGPRVLQPGDTVLALGTGGVSIFALQLGIAAGATVIVTSSSDEKLARAEALGATGLVNYATSESWPKDVVRLTEGRGADHVVEVTGALDPSLQALAVNGSMSIVGTSFATDDGRTPLTPRQILAKNSLVRGVFVGSTAMLAALARVVETCAISPVLDATFPFEEARGAYELMLSRRHFGKIVLTV
jgi:NADPH:quinone reductase-like Zn-dependent oxidoreductase